jgi:hypothetical protein
MRREDLAVHVRRDAVFEESFRELHRRSAEEWKNRFYIVFEGSISELPLSTVDNCAMRIVCMRIRYRGSCIGYGLMKPNGTANIFVSYTDSSHFYDLENKRNQTFIIKD